MSPKSGESSVLRSSMTAWCKERNHARCQEVGNPCSCGCHDLFDDEEEAPAVLTPLRAVPDAANAPDAPPSPTGIEWREPPRWQHGPPRAVPDDVLDELRSKPGRWAKVKHYTGRSSAATAAQRIRGYRGCSYGPGWEATSRLSVGGGSDLYMRWVGEQ